MDSGVARRRRDDIAVAITTGEGRLSRHRLEADVAIEELALFSDALSLLGGRARVDATLTGPLTDPSGEGSVLVQELTADGRLLGDLSASLTLQHRKLNLSPARLVGLGGDLTLEAQLELAGTLAYEGDANWSDFDAVRLAPLVTDRPVPLVALSGSAEFSGTLVPFSLSGKTDGELHPTQGGESLRWTVQGKYADSAAKGEVAAFLGAANTLAAAINITRDGNLSGRVDVDVSNVEMVRSLLSARHLPRVGGSIKLSGELSGTRSKPVLTAEVTGQDIQAFGAEIERLAGRVRVNPDALRTEGVTLSLAGGTTTAAGTFAFASGIENNWHVNLDELPVDALTELVGNLTGRTVPIENGALSAELTGRGVWSRAVINGEAQLERFHLADEPFERFELSGNATWPRWEAAVRLIHSKNERVEANLSGTELEQITVRLESTDWPLSSLRKAAHREVEGTVAVRAQLQGAPAALSGTVEATTHGLTIGDHQIGDVTIRSEVTRGNWQTQTTLLDEHVSVQARLNTQEAGLPFTAAATWTDAALGRFLGDDPALQVSTSGSLQIADRLDRLTLADGVVQIDRLQIARGHHRIHAVQPIVLRGTAGTFTIESLELQGNGTRLDVQGALQTDGVIQLSANGAGNLELFEIIGKPIESLKGHFQLAVDVERPTTGEWELSGQLSFEDAALEAGLPVALTNVSGRLTLNRDVARIEELQGRGGGGSFSLGGAVNVQHGPALTWQASRVSADLVPALEFEASGSGSIRGQWEDLVVDGEVQVLQMLYDRDFKLTDFLPTFQRAMGAPRQTAASDRTIRLDLRVHAPGDLFVENNVAHIQAKGDLHARGTVERPTLDGDIEVLDGEVFFRGRTFEITRAVIGFRPTMGLVASLNIDAETVIDTPDASYTVIVQVTGTTEDHRVVLTADDPGLSQTDIASLITFGKTVAQWQQAGGSGTPFYQQGIGLAADLLAAPIEGHVAQALPIDRVEFEPTFSPATGSFEPQMTVGKDLTEDLSASVGTTFGVEAQTKTEVAYRLTQEISGVFNWESRQAVSNQGAFGGNVEFRYEFWRVPRFSLLGGSDRGTEQDVE